MSNVSQRRTGSSSSSKQLHSSNPSKMHQLSLLSQLRTRTSVVTQSVILSAVLLLGWLYTVAIQETNLNTSGNRILSLRAPQQQQIPQQHPRRLGILVGIFTADYKNDQEYRSRHRKLFTIWNDPRVCSLGDFERMIPIRQASCELIYTFVVGANPLGPTEWMQQYDDDDESDDGTRSDNPILVGPDSGIDSNFTAKDLIKRDVTRLNIRENMNKGKSPTWFKYAYQVMETYPNDISYVMKLDADSILHLHEFFHFAYHHLPPPPFSNNIYLGSLRDKAYWPKKPNRTDAQLAEVEGYFGTEFEGVHLYLAGQAYILSKNLAKVIQTESQLIHNKLLDPQQSNTSYLEGHEDHDIAAMVYHSPEPIHLVTVGRKQRFWEHPVKGEPRWRRIWHREVARMEGRPFEGKMFTKDSLYETVMSTSTTTI